VVAASVIAIHTAPRGWSLSAGHLEPNCEGHQLIIAQAHFECEFMKPFVLVYFPVQLVIVIMT
jgi:hypothetical protein